MPEPEDNTVRIVKARRLSDSIMDSQDSFIMRELEEAEVYFGDDFEEIVADAGNNADLYAANQGRQYRFDQ